ncbi:MAG: tetratricopeptide repeat protein [Longimicrobiales bacterium]|nr:tetratricopeptide repeat protein [Longimicrobiales bacterium]
MRGRAVAFALVVCALAPLEATAQSSDVGRREAARAAWVEGRWADVLEVTRGGGADAALLALRIRTLLLTGERAAAVRAAGGRDGPAPAPALERLRGEALLAIGEREHARAAFEASIRARAPDAAVARFHLATLDLHTAARPAAIDAFDSFIDFYNEGRADTPEELVAVGRALTRLGRADSGLFRDALRAFDEAAALDPLDPAPRIALGDLFRATYQTTDAYAEYARVLERIPEHPDALVGRARAQRFDGNPDALATARRALEVDPHHPAALALVARLTLEAEGSEEARAIARDALEVDPYNLEGLSILAATHFLEDDLAGFDRVVARLDTFAPRYGGLHGTVAELAVTHRKYAEAVELARVALERDPDLHEVRGRMGMNLMRLGRIDEGRAEVEAGFAGDPFNPWFKNTLDLFDKVDGFAVMESEHFEIVLPADEADLLGPLVRETAEAAWDGLVARYGFEPPAPVRLEIYPSSADFSVRALGLAGLGALGVSFGPTLAMDSPSARGPAEFNWRSVLWHELAHTFHLSRSDHEVPRWFSEGLAMREQRVEDSRWGFKPSIAFFQAWEAGRMPPLSNLTEGLIRPRFPDQVPFTYLLASYVFDWIEEEEGFGTVLAFLDGYRAGASTEELVDERLGLGMEDADEAFDAWLRARFEGELAATTGEIAPARSPAQGAPTFGGGRDEAAIRALEEAIDAAPGAFLPRLALGTTLLARGRLDEAEVQLRQALRLFPGYDDPEGPLWGLATIHERRGETRAAADALRRLGYLSETAWEVPLREAELRREMGDLEGERDALRRATEVYPFQRDLQLRRAEVAERLDDPVEWVRARRAVLALDPVDRAEAHFEFARALLAAGELDEARTQVLRALEIAPRYEAALELLLELRRSS